MDREERFSELYRTHCDAVLRYAWRRTELETARDVVAETFLVAWRRLDAVPPDERKARPWLYGVARRVLANAERARRRTERVAGKLGDQPRSDCAPDVAAAVTERARLAQALARLRPSDQEVLRLIGWEELGLAEAAMVMGCSRSTMAVRLHRARRRLERALEAGEGPQETSSAVRTVTPVQAISKESR
jgi:RNA polymerase sigma factor (sigma-70 family)